MSAKRKQWTPAPAVEPMKDVPGPDADATALREHYRAVQNVRACHRYDDIVTRCYWCLADDQQVPRRGTRGGGNIYCTDRCADAADAYHIKVLERGREIPPDIIEVAQRRTSEKKKRGRPKKGVRV